MKIILTTPTYPPFNSGLGNAVQRQAHALSERGHEVTVATGGTERVTRSEGSVVRVETFAVQGADYLRNPIRGDVEGYLRFLQAEGSDVVLMHAWQTWSTDIVLNSPAKIAARKLVYSHCISTNMWLPYRPLMSLGAYLMWRPYWWKLASRMRQLDGVIFLAAQGDDTRFDDIRLARRLGVPLHVIPNSVAPRAETTPRERNRLIAVGSYTQAKGFDFVLEAYALSSARNRIPLALFGQEPTPYLAHLMNYAEKLGISRDVIDFRVGVSDADIQIEHGGASLVLSGSYTECQPLVLLDAMAAGTPFVARATGCISTMPGGWAVRSPLEAAQAMDHLMRDSAAWSALSEAGLDAAASTYSIDRNVAHLLEVLNGAS